MVHLNTTKTKKQYLLFPAYLAFFIVHTNQMGVGVTGYQRVIFMESKQDAWISLLIMYFVMNTVMFMICYILKSYKDKDLFDIHKSLFGKWIGGAINLIFISYLLAGFLAIILAYTEIVQAWVFPQMGSWVISSIIILLTIYGVFGGIRTVVGVCFLGFFLAIWLVFIITEPMTYMDLTFFHPILEANPKELIMGAYKASFTVLGFESILFVYPYIRNKEKVPFYAHLAVGFTGFLLILIMIVSIGYFSGEQLELTIWATLSMFKIIHFPNLERFEFVTVSVWLIVILPNVLIMMWSATRGLKKTFRLKQKSFVLICSTLIFIISLFFRKRVFINEYIDMVGQVGFAIVFGYSSLLFLIVFLSNVRKKVGEKNGA